MIADYHMHTMYSDDSTALMEEEVKQAIALGLDEICFTEHVDYGIKTDKNCPYYFYFREGKYLQEKYKDKITIKLGIEFGLQVAYIDMFQRDFDAYQFDFVILSNHQVDNQEFWTYEFQEGRTQEEYIQTYYEAILECVKKHKNYSVLGHLDMIKRYDQTPRYPDEKVRPILIEILKEVIKDGKGIEVNTSSFQYKLDDLMPSTYILKLYKELGGTIITIGSDTHTVERVGDHIEYVQEKLKEIGFTEIYTFNKMRPIANRL